MTPRSLVPAVLVTLSAAVAVPLAAQAGGDDEEAIRRRFVGHYELVVYESFRENGDVVDMDYSGRILYDEHGNMSAIGMPNDLPERARRSDSNVQGGFAYWARVSFDVGNGIVVHHVEGSPTRGSWPGVDNVRYFEWTEDGLLKLSLRNDEGRTTGTLTWRRIDG
jgi:hypothetical protein